MREEQIGRESFPLYSVIKILLGAMSLALSIEYCIVYARYRHMDNGYLYLGDLAIWLLIGLILIGEGLGSYMQYLYHVRVQ